MLENLIRVRCGVMRRSGIVKAEMVETQAVSVCTNVIGLGTTSGCLRGLGRFLGNYLGRLHSSKDK